MIVQKWCLRNLYIYTFDCGLLTVQINILHQRFWDHTWIGGYWLKGILWHKTVWQLPKHQQKVFHVVMNMYLVTSNLKALWFSQPFSCLSQYLQDVWPVLVVNYNAAIDELCNLCTVEIYYITYLCLSYVSKIGRYH